MKIKIPKTYELSISSNKQLESHNFSTAINENDTIIYGSLHYKDIKVVFKANANSTLDMQRLHELGYEDGELLEKTVDAILNFEIEIEIDNNDIRQKYDNLDKTFKLNHLNVSGVPLEYPIISTIKQSIMNEIVKLIENDPEFIQLTIK